MVAIRPIFPISDVRYGGKGNLVKITNGLVAGFLADVQSYCVALGKFGVCGRLEVAQTLAAGIVPKVLVYVKLSYCG
ncbi:MAG: hypothetical protein CML04_01335 [Pseudozobellia sp.]|nr:hypothetical protein [Pseudozobellia sp.]MBG48827.1 hypothetical protein [Pseudozobellia sp.]|tara:strand:+ start:601 stop:831 length:231 start_codon:yes stop_codon:yes gene_type:complete